MRFRMPFGARAAFTAVLALLTFAPAAMAVDEVNTKKLRDNVTVNGILGHERALQRIANMNGGTRASGTPGYDASAAYVANRLQEGRLQGHQAGVRLPVLREPRSGGAVAGLADADGLRDGHLRLLGQR